MEVDQIERNIVDVQPHPACKKVAHEIKNMQLDMDEEMEVINGEENKTDKKGDEIVDDKGEAEREREDNTGIMDEEMYAEMDTALFLENFKMQIDFLLILFFRCF